MSHKENDQTSQEGAEDATFRFRADFLGELDAWAAGASEAGMGEIEGLPSGAALLVVKCGPAAGASFGLRQPVTSAGRHRDSDIFFDDGSRRHIEFRSDNSEFQIVDISSPNRTCVNRKSVLLVGAVERRYPRW